MTRVAGALRKTLLALAAGVLLAVGTGVAPAFAHAELEGASPEEGAVLETAPSQVELRFNEPVQLVDGSYRLFPGDGSAAVKLHAKAMNTSVVIALPDGLGNGSYAVAYRVVSADGHPLGAVLDFQVGHGSYPAPKVTSIADPRVTELFVAVFTAVQYLALLAFVGLLFFDLVILRSDGPDPRTRRLLRYGYGFAAAAALLLLPASGSRVTGNEFVTYIPESGSIVILPIDGWAPGVSWQVIAAALTITALGLAALILAYRARTRPLRFTALGLGALALAAPLLVGHTQTVQPGWIMMLADYGHLAAGAFWVGGVIGLLRFLIAASPAAKGDDAQKWAGTRVLPKSALAAARRAPRISPVRAAAVVAEFSRYALWSVIVLAASGLTMAVLILRSWELLLGSAYGRTLLIKLGIVVAVVAVAAWNRRFLLPRIAAHPEVVRQWEALRRTLVVETLLLIGVLGVTGFLTNASPLDERRAAGIEQGGGSGSATPAPGADTSVHVESQGLTVDGALSGGRVGENTLTFTLEYEGAALSDLATEDVTVQARLPEQNLGPIVARVSHDAASGEYVAVLSLPAAGAWQLEVLARVDTFAQPIALVPVAIR